MLHFCYFSSVPNISMNALGMENSIITDSQITYSSGSITSPGPRLNTNGQWTAGLNDSNQWLQISLYRQTNITGVVLMGHPTSNLYVSRYRVEICLDGVSWENVADENGDAEVLCKFVSSLSLSLSLNYIWKKPMKSKSNTISALEEWAITLSGTNLKLVIIATDGISFFQLSFLSSQEPGHFMYITNKQALHFTKKKKKIKEEQPWSNILP